MKITWMTAWSKDHSGKGAWRVAVAIGKAREMADAMERRDRRNT